MFNLSRAVPAGAAAEVPTPVDRRKRRLTAVFGTVLVVGVAAQLHLLSPGGSFASAATVTPQPLVAGRALSGVTSHGGLNAVNNFGNWRGKAAQVEVGYITVETWATMTNVAAQGLTQTFAGSNVHRVYSMGLLPLDGEGTLEQAAAGQFNSKYVTIAKALVAGGDGSSTIRLGWEGNGNWYSWSGDKDPAAFAGAYRQEVTAMRSVAGAHFTFDWNMSLGYQDPTNMYPGDAYVDIVGWDMYDYTWAVNASDHVASWNQKLTENIGVNWMANFAAKHGKRISLPEWGLSYRCDDNHDGGDDTYFIQQMHNFIATHDVAYESYFNADDSACHAYTLNDGHFSNAAALYKKLWSGSSGGTTTPPTTAPPTTTKPPTSKPPTSAPPTSTKPTVPPTTTPPTSGGKVPTGTFPLADIRGSKNSNRGSSFNLDGSQLSGNAYFFVTPAAGTKSVKFYLDKSLTGTPDRTEVVSPYDFESGSGSAANAFNVNSLSKGWHGLGVVVTLANGTTQSITAYFKAV
jgi:hypothetical protein